MKIKINDTVKIIAGKDKGKTGKVTHSFPEKNRIVIDGINVQKRNQKPRKQGEKGQIIQMPMPVNVSNTMIMCPSCKKPVRIGKKKVGSKNIRSCKKCAGEL